MKDGYKTTEFWLTFIGVLLSILVASGTVTVGDSDYLQEVAAAAVPIIISVYAWGRAKVKAG